MYSPAKKKLMSDHVVAQSQMQKLITYSGTKTNKKKRNAFNNVNITIVDDFTFYLIHIGFGQLVIFFSHTIQ